MFILVCYTMLRTFMVDGLICDNKPNCQLGSLFLCAYHGLCSTVTIQLQENVLGCGNMRLHYTLFRLFHRKLVLLTHPGASRFPTFHKDRSSGFGPQFFHRLVNSGFMWCLSQLIKNLCHGSSKLHDRSQ